LQAASTAEPQVLRKLLEVGDVVALETILERLACVPLFRDLCRAYSELLTLGLRKEFPPLHFMDVAGHTDFRGALVELGLGNCGELWVMLLLLLPEHLRAAIAEELAEPTVSRDIAKAVRCPWALPLEALRDTLSHLLQLPGATQCAHE